MIISITQNFVNCAINGAYDTHQQNCENTEKLAKTIEKYAEKHKNALKIAKKLRTIGLEGRAIRMENCSTELSAKICPECGQTHVTRATLCRDKLCPVCNWRLSRKRYTEMFNVFQYINIADYQAYFLTLTVKNCLPSELSGTLDKMCSAWNRLASRKSFKKYVVGWARSVEITYNNSTRMFHPHFHIILLEKNFGKSFFKVCDYMTAWRECLRVDYDPITDYREIRGDGAQEGYNAILETFKYSLKDKEVAKIPKSEFRELVYAINNRRMVAYGGVIKTARVELKYKDDDYEEIQLNKQCNCTAEQIEMVLKWSTNNSAYGLMVNG